MGHEVEEVGLAHPLLDLGRVRLQPREHLVHQHAEGVHVRGLARALGLLHPPGRPEVHQLRRHPPDRARGDLGRRVVRVLRPLDVLQAVVGELRLQPVVQQHVHALQVPVHDGRRGLVVEVLQPRDHVHAAPQEQIEVEGGAAVDHRVQRAVDHELAHEHEGLVRRHHHPEGRDDVRVVELRPPLDVFERLGVERLQLAENLGLLLVVLQLGAQLRRRASAAQETQAPRRERAVEDRPTRRALRAGALGAPRGSVLEVVHGPTVPRNSAGEVVALDGAELGGIAGQRPLHRHRPPLQPPPHHVAVRALAEDDLGVIEADLPLEEQPRQPLPPPRFPANSNCEERRAQEEDHEDDGEDDRQDQRRRGPARIIRKDDPVQIRDHLAVVGHGGDGDLLRGVVEDGAGTQALLHVGGIPGHAGVLWSPQ